MKRPKITLFIVIILLTTKLLAQNYQIENSRLDSIFKANSSPSNPGYAVLVIKDGEKIFEKTYGARELGGEALTPNTPFYLASLSKQFTAAAIIMLKEKGKLNYDDKVKKFINNVPDYAKEVTIRNLLTHTSGLLDHYEIVGENVSDLTNKQVFDIISAQDSLQFEPNTKNEYSNSAYVLLAILIEKITGKTYADFLRDNIFLPLNMSNTFVVDEQHSSPQNRAIGYSKESTGNFIENDYNLFTTGAGGIYSTIEDLYKWDQALYTDKLISKTAMRDALTKHKLNTGEPIGYGFGWMLGEFEEGKLKGKSFTFHSGSLKGFRNMIMRIPEDQFTFIILSNAGEHLRLRDLIPEIYLKK